MDFINEKGLLFSINIVIYNLVPYKGLLFEII